MEKDKGIKKLLVLLVLLALLQIVFIIGYTYGQVSAVLAITDAIKTDEIIEKLDEQENIVYINQTCNYDEKDIYIAKQEMLLKYYGNGYLTMLDLETQLNK